MFLHLRASNSGFELLEAKTVPGLLKVPQYDGNREGLHFVLLSNENQVLFQDVCAEPTVRRLEYEDPEQPGRIVAKQVGTGNTEFTIRVPYFSEGRTVRFYRHPSTLSGGTTANRSTHLVLEGEITLPSSIR